MERGLFYFVLCLHFVCMLAYNLSSTLRGYHQLMGERTGPYYLQVIQRAAATITSSGTVRYPARYAGTATGYGFFAPQVGSSFRLEVSVPDGLGVSRRVTAMPAFKRAHSQIRYSSLLNNHMQHLLHDDTAGTAGPTLANRRARAIAHCLAQRLAPWSWRSSFTQVRCEVFVYGTPRLWPREKPHLYRMLVYRHDINHFTVP